MRKLITIAALGATILVVTGVALADSSNERDRREAGDRLTSRTRQGRRQPGYAVELTTTPANGAKSCIANRSAGWACNGQPDALDGATSCAAPEALVYEPRGDALKLVALEYAVDRKAWHAAGNSKAPKLFGREFALVTKNPFGLKPFYALHAWIWKKNPAGWLQPWNPSVSCPS